MDPTKKKPEKGGRENNFLKRGRVNERVCVFHYFRFQFASKATAGRYSYTNKFSYSYEYNYYARARIEFSLVILVRISKATLRKTFAGSVDVRRSPVIRLTRDSFAGSINARAEI